MASELCSRESIEVVYNLVAMLSAKGEQDPMAAWALNMEPFLHTLELAREGLLRKCFGRVRLPSLGPTPPNWARLKTQP